MLEIRDLTKYYQEGEGQLVVLDHVSLWVPASQFVCLLGPSGCGKTTLIRVVVGLTVPDGGTVAVDGKTLRAPGTDCSIVFQNYGLLPWRTVMGNVEFGLEIRGVAKDERRRIAQGQIDRVALSGFERHFPHQLSGGMQQRCGLARALTKDPKVLLMDEPFAAVDMQTREFLQDELLRVWHEVRTTVIFVTHSIDEAIYLSDRVVVMGTRPGRIVADVPVDLPRPRYASDVKASPRFGELRHEVREALLSGQPGDGTRTREVTRSEPRRPPGGRDRHGSAGERTLPAASPTRRIRLVPNATAIRVLSVLATLVLWEWVGRDINPIFFSYPSAILSVVPSMLRSGELVAIFLASMQPFAVGFGLAIVIGVVLGLLMGRYRLMENLLEAQITALYSTPNVALIPLVILWFGLGAQAKVFIVLLSAVFPILINTQDGVRNVSRGFVEIGQAEGARPLQIFTKIILSASLPFIMSGIRLSIGRAVVGIVVAEMFTAITGLGGAIVYYGNQFATAKLLVVVIVLSLLGVLLTQSARATERRLALWKETERAQ